MNKNICVIGATGVAGSAFLDFCLPGGDSKTEHRVTASSEVAGRNTETETVPDDWSYYAVSRKAVETNRGNGELRTKLLTPVSADLLGDYSQLQKQRSITHVVFAGFVPAEGFDKQVDPNRRLLENCLQALSHCPLEHVVLLQGMKYYGSHLGAFKTPAREDDARHDGPNYYYAQQDLLQASGIDWTCLRPHVICGTSSFGTTQNILAVLAVYASICKENKQPLNWPGSSDSFEKLNQATDAQLLARAIAWALKSPAARNQAFNITNGDFFRWQNLWPKIADVFELPCGEVKSQALATEMPNHEALWTKMAQTYALQSSSMQTLADWKFADYILNTGWDVMADTGKARKHGFPLFADTEEMYVSLLRRMREQKIVP